MNSNIIIFQNSASINLVNNQVFFNRDVTNLAKSLKNKENQSQQKIAKSCTQSAQIAHICLETFKFNQQLVCEKGGLPEMVDCHKKKVHTFAYTPY